MNPLPARGVENGGDTTTTTTTSPAPETYAREETRHGPAKSKGMIGLWNAAAGIHRRCDLFAGQAPGMFEEEASRNVWMEAGGSGPARQRYVFGTRPIHHSTVTPRFRHTATSAVPPSATTSDERKRLDGGDEEDDDNDDEDDEEQEDDGEENRDGCGGGDDDDDDGSCFTTISEASRVRMSSRTALGTGNKRKSRWRRRTNKFGVLSVTSLFEDGANRSTGNGKHSKRCSGHFR
uniref:Uncharacterized protein n=1 Tax=Anopheles farauti TaxID=69004 RepID=A0A182QQ92_9DIPT